MAELELKMNAAGVDPALIGWLQAAARLSPYRVVAYSGKREGDPRFHGKGQAIDINLIDTRTGKTVPNYQNAEGFAAYQAFANMVRAAQMQMNPERSNALRWGGYFSGAKGKYGALDSMHFDTGGDTTPMGGGSWEGGLTPEQAALWGLSPGGGVSGASAPISTTPLGSTLGDATAPIFDTPEQGLASAFAAGVGGGGSKSKQPTPVGMIGDDGESGGIKPVSLEAPTAIVPEGYLGPPGNSFLEDSLGSPGNLSEIFKVKDIGTPKLQPGRRF